MYFFEKKNQSSLEIEEKRACVQHVSLMAIFFQRHNNNNMVHRVVREYRGVASIFSKGSTSKYEV